MYHQIVVRSIIEDWVSINMVIKIFLCYECIILEKMFAADDWAFKMLLWECMPMLKYLSSLPISPRSPDFFWRRLHNPAPFFSYKSIPMSIKLGYLIDWIYFVFFHLVVLLISFCLLELPFVFYEKSRPIPTQHYWEHYAWWFYMNSPMNKALCLVILHEFTNESLKQWFLLKIKKLKIDWTS